MNLTLRAPKGLTAGACGVSLPREVLRNGVKVATLTYPSCYSTVRLEYAGGSRVFASDAKALRWAADWIAA